MQDTGFTEARFYSADWGKAAATKLTRSVMVKGLEALITESLLSARYYGVEDAVLNSFANLIPHPDWPEFARYMMSRAIIHGLRRSEEMIEAAKTVREAGIDPLMSLACAKRQAWAAQFKDTTDMSDLKTLLGEWSSRLDNKAMP